jgi:hypothetical protein
MKTLIFFREGLSGHYLKSIIDDSTDKINFRVDPWYPGIYNKLRLDVLNLKCVCLHPSGLNITQLQSQFDLTVTIQVHQNIYHGIYNNFYKKFLIENPDQQHDFKNWQKNPVLWYDRTFYNMKEYHTLYRQDAVNNTIANVIDFDRMLELDYIEHLLKLYYNQPMTKNMCRIVSDYKSLQLQRDLSGNEKTMHDIVASLDDQDFADSPWFAAYCIFKYETNNGLNENQRQWSIDRIERPIDRSFLLSIADQYSN